MNMTYTEKLKALRERITIAYPNTEWEFDPESSILIEKTDYFNRYTERIVKYTSFSPNPFFRYLFENELEIDDIVVISDSCDEWFGITID